MPDTDTQSRVTTFVPPIVVQSRYEPYSRSIRNFSYATSTHHDRYAAFEAALAKAGIAKWTLYDILEASDEATIKRIFLEYFDGEPSKLFPDKTEQELNSTVPKEVIDAYLPHIDELHNAQQHDQRLFAKQLTDNFVAQLRRQHIPLPEDLETRLETRVEGVLPDIIRQSPTLGDAQRRVQQYLVGALAFIPETQQIAQSQQTTLEQASQEAIGASRQTIIDLMARPQELTQTIAVPVLDKANFETVLTKLVKETPTISVARHAIHAETLVRTLEATNATIVGADAARAAGQLLVALAQESNKPLGVAVAALLAPQTRNRIFDAIATRSWEQAVDNVTRRAAAGLFDPDLINGIVARNSQQFGPSGGKGGVVAARGFAEALWGNIAGPMENYIVSQHDLSKKFGMPLPQRQFTSIELFMAVSYAYAQGPPIVVMHGEGQKEGGGFLRFILSFGAQEGAGFVVRRGLSTAASRTAGTGLGRFVGWLAGVFGARAGGVAAGAAAGSVAPGIGTIIGAVVGFVGGSLVMPAINWVGKLFKGEVGPLGAWVTGLQSYFGRVGSGTDAVSQQKRTDLVIGIFIAVAILPVLPLVGALLTPTQQITTQNAALLTSYEAASRDVFDIDLNYDGPFPDQVGLIAGCPTVGRITQGPLEGRSHGNVDAYDFGAPWNSPVYATHDGFVATAVDGYAPWFYCDTRDCSFGNVVIIAGTGPGPNDHYTTTYAHLLTVAVSQGQQVEAGKTLLGYVDATGYTFDENGNPGGIHLHYQYNGPGRLELPAGCGT